MSENIEVEKLKVRASDLNAINKSISSATINAHAVYVGSLRDAVGYHSSKMILYICQFLCNANIYISLLRNGQAEFFRIAKGESQILQDHDSTRVLFVKNTLHNTYDVYVTGSYSRYSTVGYIYIQSDPTILSVRPIGELVNVVDLTIEKEFLIKEIPELWGGGKHCLISKYKAVGDNPVNRRKHNYGLPLRFPIQFNRQIN